MTISSVRSSYTVGDLESVLFKISATLIVDKSIFSGGIEKLSSNHFFPSLTPPLWALFWVPKKKWIPTISLCPPIFSHGLLATPLVTGSRSTVNAICTRFKGCPLSVRRPLCTSPAAGQKPSFARIHCIDEFSPRNMNRREKNVCVVCVCVCVSECVQASLQAMGRAVPAKVNAASTCR
ncbi:hypothetical protein AA313_de0202623 [Arthrobotrys entomopaga]|nr:hypothetical protein AA313_de0202623 [Arthrobotrys entomopaga]